MEKEKLTAGELIEGMKKLLIQFNKDNEVGIERIDVECRDVSTISGKGFTYTFHLTFT